MKYEIPESLYYRLHHVRPRFKNDIESVLIFIANEISALGRLDKETFKANLDEAIKKYPNNDKKTEKTIKNWRTEISSLFGFVQSDGNLFQPSAIAKALSEKQDLIEFFKYFLFYFQYPGGHLKPKETLEMISKGIKFHPAKYIIQVFIEGNKLNPKSTFTLSKAETTHCIFNDLSVTRDARSPEETVSIIIKNRENNMEYDSSGDTTRYAGDILDYMVLADLLSQDFNNQYCIKAHHTDALNTFIDECKLFPHYNSFYGKTDLAVADITRTQNNWFDFINSDIDKKEFITKLEHIPVKQYDDTETNAVKKLMLIMQKRADKSKAPTPHEIGQFGEALVIHHEKNRIALLGRDDLIDAIEKIPDYQGVGYDIESFLGEHNDFKNIQIEVKTTISKNKLIHQSFHMTSNEWRSANKYRDTYFIYRIFISFENDPSLFIIRNPAQQHEKRLIYMEPVDKVKINYNEKSGKFERLNI